MIVAGGWNRLYMRVTAELRLITMVWRRGMPIGVPTNHAGVIPVLQTHCRN